MKKFVPLVKNSALFDGINDDDLEHLLACLNAKVTEVKKNSFIWMQGDSHYNVGLVLHGKVNIIKEDIMGNRSLIAGIEAPHIFGESLVSSGAPQSPVSVQAAMDSTIMLIDFLRLVKTCNSACAFHSRLIQNMMKIIAQKNMYLNEKIDYLKRTTTRQKVATYLINHISDKIALKAIIPLNREEFADYLGVNRSALSRELSSMKEEGLIEYKKNKFSILDYASINELVF